jgi:hypothetical protein
MTTTLPHHWIHLDLKGMVPAFPRLLEWLSWFREHGMDTVLFEYEDRIQWNTFPGTCREVYTREQWQQIHRHCEQIGLRTVPLIQCYGHLEWLLKHPQWAHLRCNGRSNLLCAQNPQTRQVLRAWIAETAQLHPDSEYIHVGLDEVYHIAGCPACQQRMNALPEGKMGIMLEHAQFVCETVLEHGKRPILWADMFLKEKRQDWIERIPPQAVLCDWLYHAQDVAARSTLTNNQGRQAMGASAIRCIFPPTQTTSSVQARIDNVIAWHQDIALRADPQFTALIHTTWGRSRSLAPLYGPWEGWLPAFLAAGHGEISGSDELQSGLAIWQQHRAKKDYHEQLKAAQQIAQLASHDPLETQALHWWALALRYEAEWDAFVYHYSEQEALSATMAHVGRDDNLLEINREAWRQFDQRTEQLKQEMRLFLEANQWSDIEEYIDSRFRAMRQPEDPLIPASVSSTRTDSAAGRQ